MRTYFPKQGDIKPRWFIIDAEGKVLGRLSTTIATILAGKNKPTYTPFLDTGDFVIVINAHKVKVTGAKATNKFYHTHSGYPGAIRSESFEKAIVRHPDLPVTEAVKGMLPKNVLGREMLAKLKVYGAAEHPHKAQQPKALPL